MNDVLKTTGLQFIVHRSSFIISLVLLVAGGAHAQRATEFPVTFVDAAQSAGLTSPIIYGGVERKRYIVETNGCGVAFFDYDGDGWADVLLLNGTRLEGFPRGQAPTLKLYRNKRDG